MSVCDLFFDNCLPTSALAVAFVRISYGNEPIYRDLHLHPELFKQPHPTSGPQAAQAFISSQSFRKPSGQPFSLIEAIRGPFPVIEECGIGIYLYLYSLKYFAIVFALCSLFAAAQVAIDYNGGYYEEKYGDWSQYFPCWGNSKAISRGSDIRLHQAQSEFEEMERGKKLQVIMDAAYTVVLLVALIVYAVKTRIAIERYRNHTPTLADYAVKFTQVAERHIPEIATILESAGIEIHEIVPVRHVNKLLNHLALHDVKSKQQVLTAVESHRYVTYRNNIALHRGMLESVLAHTDILEKSHSLIVVFEHRNGRAAALKLFRKMWVTAWWQKVKVLWQKLRKQERNWISEVNAKWMSVPDEVYWDNIKKKQYIARVMFYWIGIVVILATASVVFALRGQQNDVDKNTIAKDSIDSTRDSDMKNRVKSGSIKFLIGACIAFINVVIPWMLNKFITAQEKQSTLPRVKLSAMFKIFLFMLLNSNFVILVVNADFHNYEVGKVLPMIDSRFDDMSRDWYLEVGFSIQMSLFLTIFSPHVFWCLYYSSKMWLLPKLYNYFDSQLAYNHWALGDPIDLPCQTSIQLVVIFCCLNYSGGMPLMLPICSLILFSMFICEVRTLRHIRKPRENSTILHAWFLNLVPWAIILHCWFSAYMFGADSIVPYESPEHWYERNNDGPFDANRYTQEVRNPYQDRASDYCGVTFLVLSGMVGIAMMVSAFVQREIRKKYKVDQQSLTDRMRAGGMKGGESYYMFRNKNYTKFYNEIFDEGRESVDEEGRIGEVKKEAKMSSRFDQITGFVDDSTGRLQNYMI